MAINTLACLTLISGFIGNAAALMAVVSDLSYHYSTDRPRACKLAARILSPVALIGIIGFLFGMAALIQRAQ